MSAIPMLDWLGGYQKGWLRLDLVAGLTTARACRPSPHRASIWSRSCGPAHSASR